MPPTIPQQLFEEITRREHALTSADLNSLGWKQALSASQQRQDHMARLITSTATGGIACQAGCWYCCYFKVEIRSEEALQIVDFVRENFSPARVKRLHDDVADNADALRNMTREQQLTANRKCPFLDDGKCSIYAVRPARCRTFHAKDVSGCKQAWDEPANLKIPSTLVPELLYAGEAHLQGYRQAFTDAGYDNGVSEMNAALEKALAIS